MSEAEPGYLRVQLPENLCSNSYPSETDGYYIVQIIGPESRAECQNKIESLSGIIYHSFPKYALLVKMSEDTKYKVEDLDTVRWVGIFQPFYKLASDTKWSGTNPSEREYYIPLLSKSGTVNLSVQVFFADEATSVAAIIESLGGIVTSIDESDIITTIDASNIPAIACIIEVHSVMEYKAPEII